ncbi:asparagine--tRNA ligase, cytoplasmic-like isoform X2 [Bombus affinis]|nr:asparagine--tRNA ligase, cytoplasmic-like isoform X2 [Bombus affinis]
MFITLRDGTGFLQCVLTNILCQTYNALTLSTEASTEVFGMLKIVPDGKNAPNGHELHVDYWRLIGTPPGGADTILNEEVLPDVQLDNKHIMMIFGENDIPEMSERKMTDAVNEPTMLCRFLTEIKSFYMQRCADDKRLTESVDVHLLYVGERFGASMRIWDYDELLEGYSYANIDTKPYYWYTDQ